MTPLLELGVKLDRSCRYVEGKGKIAYATNEFDDSKGGPNDNKLTHSELAQKYELSAQNDESGRPVVEMAGLIERKQKKLLFTQKTSTCVVAGNFQQRQEALRKTQRLAARILGEDNVIIED